MRNSTCTMVECIAADAERLFVLNGHLEPDDAQRLVVAINNHTKSQLQHLDCDHVIYVDYRLEYCIGKSGCVLTNLCTMPLCLA